ncbi:MAG: hypothetical protein GY697_24555 [Desulfobacterales bacterium]|nr:hypothetical protein [Desulfobacterales bacterium]
MHNVLADYTKRLEKNRVSGSKHPAGAKSVVDRINISVGGKRQAVIDKVAANIIDRITQFGPQDEIDREIVKQLKDEMGAEGKFKDQGSVEFVFNVIDSGTDKTTNKLTAEDSSVLMKRLETLTREAVDKNMV